MVLASSSMPRESVLHGEDICLERGGRVLAAGLRLELGAGERGLVLGPNGSGKSTLAAGICRLLPLAGRIARPDFVGYAPQEPVFPAHRRAGEYLRELAALGGARAQAPAQAAAALAQFELADAGPRRIGELSRGWRQRLNLARAWLGAPRLVVLDEPQTALDPDGMAALLRALSAAAAPAVLIVAPAGVGCETLAPVLLRLAGPGAAP